MIPIFVTLVTSALAWRWPVVGLVCFLLAYTGLQAAFEQLRILGPATGPLRADNIALLVAILSLLRRPRMIPRDPYLEIPLWSITAIIPLALVFTSSTTYEFAANGWRIFLLMPLYLALLRLRFAELQAVRYTLVILMGITGLFTLYLYKTNNVDLYLRMSAFRQVAEQFEGLRNVAIEQVRMTLPGAYSFYIIGLFLGIGLLLQQKARWFRLKWGLVAVCLGGVFAGVMVTLSRFLFVGIVVGYLACILMGIQQPALRRKWIMVTAATGVLLLVIATTTPFFSDMVSAWNDRFETATESDSWTTRKQNNLRYLEILSQRAAFLGHPSFEEDNVIVNGYNDTTAPVGLWWYYGLIPSLCYVWLMGLIGYRLFAKCLNSGAQHPTEAHNTIVIAGLFVCYQIGSFSGINPQAFDWAFAMTYLLAEWTRATLGTARVTRWQSMAKPAAAPSGTEGTSNLASVSES